MKQQIYNFEKCMPPVLNENMLMAELEKRKVQKQTAMIAIAGALVQIAVILLAVVTYPVYPGITFACTVYVTVSMVGSAFIAMVYTKLRRLVVNG